MLYSTSNTAAVNALIIYTNQTSTGSTKQFLRIFVQELVQEQFEQCSVSQIPREIRKKITAVARKIQKSLLQHLGKAADAQKRAEETKYFCKNCM
jgi:hypothetical protein